MLTTDAAVELYHRHAAKMPIIDYHCHLDPKMIARNHRFSGITEAWLGGDIINGARCGPTAFRKSI